MNQKKKKKKLISLLKENDNKSKKNFKKKFDVYKKFEEKQNKLTNEKYNHMDENTEEKSLIIKKENIIIRLFKKFKVGLKEVKNVFGFKRNCNNDIK